ncbi:MAG: radical SAM protein, partial [Candidatus Poribacteria bacterium]
MDKYGREINYLRISVTDRCNLRCTYCMPAEGISLIDHQDILRYEEITRLVWLSYQLGFRKFRITGGEPLVRKGVPSLIR